MGLAISIVSTVKEKVSVVWVGVVTCVVLVGVVSQVSESWEVV